MFQKRHILIFTLIFAVVIVGLGPNATPSQPAEALTLGSIELYDFDCSVPSLTLFVSGTFVGDGGPGTPDYFRVVMTDGGGDGTILLDGVLSAPDGATTYQSSFTLLAQPRANLIIVDIYEATSAVDTAGPLIDSAKKSSPCLPFGDGRLNNNDFHQTAAVYCQSKPVPGIEIFRIIDGMKGESAIFVSAQQIANAGVSASNQLLGSAFGISLYRLSDGTYQVNAPGLEAGHIYTFMWDTCDSAFTLPAATGEAFDPTDTTAPSTSNSDPSAVYTGSDLVHVVQKGENLFRIALRYGISMDALAAVNGIEDPSRIFAGMRLTIPSGGIDTGTTSTAPSTSTDTTTDANEATGGPNMTNSDTVEMDAGSTDDNGVNLGMAGPIHVVQFGDTLYTVARRYGVSVRMLAEANDLTIYDFLYTGDRIVIPLR
jgi:LysM repeat protein